MQRYSTTDILRLGLFVFRLLKAVCTPRALQGRGPSSIMTAGSKDLGILTAGGKDRQGSWLSRPGRLPGVYLSDLDDRDVV